MLPFESVRKTSWRGIFAALAVCGALRCGGGAAPAGPAENSASRPHVLLVTVDTLRADRLSCYGSSTTRTPRIDRLASEGTLFEAAASPMQITRPSHFSLFTSVYPRDHGVVNNAIALGPELPTVTEVFRDAGYETAAFVAVKLLDAPSGAARGFEHFDAPEDTIERGADEIAHRAITWLGARDRKRPFFLWLHFFDPHTPYAPPDPFAPACSEKMKREMPEADWDSISRLAEANGGELPREAYDRAVSLYGGEVEKTDHWLGTLLDGIDASGLRDTTIVALTADHGECFEGGFYFDHAGCLYDGAVLIPLIFRYPGAVPAAARRPEMVEILDVAPTLAALAGLKPPPGFRGRSLFDPADAAREAAFIQHPVYSARQAHAREKKLSVLHGVEGLPDVRTPLLDADLTGVRTTEWKYLLTGEHEELYRVPSAEVENEAATRRDVVARLRPLLEKWKADHPLHAPREEAPGENLQRTLKSLGYVQ